SEQLCEEFYRLIDTKRAAYEELVEAYAILQAFSNSRQRREPFPQLGTNQQENKEKIIEAFGKIRSFAAANLTKRRSQGMLATKTLEYEAIFAKAAYYEFSETDFNRIQVLMNEMRDLIRESALITDDHKRRLLRRLEAMQAELHKKTRDIERFWGFIGEAGIVIRKFGERSEER